MEEGDVLLNAHRCAIGGAEGIEYIYSVTLPAARVDIDITTRCEIASRLVEAAWRKDMLKVYPLLIVGGGVAGVTAAMTALSLGVDGVAISSGPVFFELQRTGTHRYLHPNIYKWPQQGCLSDNYAPPKWGFRWEADVAQKVVDQWDRQLPFVVDDGRYRRLDPIPDGVTVRATADVTRLLLTEHEEQEWGMVLLCIAPKENTTVGDFTGENFWQPDRLDEKNCGCVNEKHSVLVCGSGDGALQDFLRVSCPGQNIKALHERLENMFDEIRQIESQDIREALGKIDSLPKDDFEDIHGRCEALIEEIFASEEGKGAVRRFSESVCAAFPKSRSITLVWTREYFQKCYLLNRFLTLLIGRWRSEFGGEVFVKNARMNAVDPVDSQFRVGFEGGNCCLHGRFFDRVVPRFGVDDYIPVSSEGHLCLQKKPISDKA